MANIIEFYPRWVTREFSKDLEKAETLAEAEQALALRASRMPKPEHEICSMTGEIVGSVMHRVMMECMDGPREGNLSDEEEVLLLNRISELSEE